MTDSGQGVTGHGSDGVEIPAVRQSRISGGGFDHYRDIGGTSFGVTLASHLSPNKIKWLLLKYPLLQIWMRTWSDVGPHLGSPCYLICQGRQGSRGGAVGTTKCSSTAIPHLLSEEIFRSPHITLNYPTWVDQWYSQGKTQRYAPKVLGVYVLWESKKSNCDSRPRFCTGKEGKSGKVLSEDNNARQLAICNLTKATFKIALHYSEK